MKILWIVNMVMPKLARYMNVKTGNSGTWMFDLSDRLSKDKNIDLAIACVFGDKYQEVFLDDIKYYILPGNGKNMLFYTKKYEKMWKKVYDSFIPDIVHLHGTEYSHGLSFLRKFPNVVAVVSIQGILNRIKEEDLGGIPLYKFFWFRTLHECIKLNGVIEMKILHHKNSKYEKEIINRSKYANCVNTWDESIVRYINPKIKCYKIDYNLREEFYNSIKWNKANIQEYRIFTNPSGTPLKGLHMLLKALAIVKDKYPFVKLVVPGFSSNEKGQLNITNGYSKYISHMIKKLNLLENVEFLGSLSADEMVSNILKANIVVIPSAIEGTSLILREAMFLGAPCIASFRGGMADFISDKEDGYLYDYKEFPYLANRISNLFENIDICEKFSKNAIIKTELSHNREKNQNLYIDMYHNILN